MYLDGDDQPPTIAGTGTEDYTGMAWGLGKFAHRFQGWPGGRCRPPDVGVSNRFHVPDPVFFEADLKVTIRLSRNWRRQGQRICETRASRDPGFGGSQWEVHQIAGAWRSEPHRPELPEVGSISIGRTTTAPRLISTLDKPIHDLPPMPALDVRMEGIK